MVAVTRKKKIHKGGSYKYEYNPKYGQFNYSQKPNYGNSATRRLGQNFIEGAKPVARYAAAVVTSPLWVPAAAVGYAAGTAAGVLGASAGLLRYAAKAAYRKPAEGISWVIAKKSERIVAQKLGGLNQPKISKKLSGFELEKQKLDADYAQKMADYTQKSRTGKATTRDLSSLESSYKYHAENLLKQIETEHSKQKLGLNTTPATTTGKSATTTTAATVATGKSAITTGKSATTTTTLKEKIKAVETARTDLDPTAKLTLSEKLDLALTQSKTNLANRYETAKVAYETKRQEKIKTKKAELGYNKAQTEFTKSQASLTTSQADFTKKQEALDALISKNPKNYMHTPDFRQLTERLQNSGQKYRENLKEFEITSKQFTQKEKELAKALRSTRTWYGFKKHDGSNKDIEFYEGKAKSWKNTFRRHKHESQEDLKDIYRLRDKMSTFGISKLQTRLGLNHPKREKYSVKSEYNTMSRTDFNPFGIKLGTSKLRQIDKMKEFLDTKTSLLDLDTQIKDTQSKIDSPDSINEFDNVEQPNILNSVKASKFESINELRQNLDALVSNDPQNIVKKTELENQLKLKIKDYYTTELDSLNLDKGKRQKLLTIAQLTTNNLISEKDYAKNIQKIHENPEYNDLLSKMLNPKHPKADIIDGLTDAKDRLIQVSNEAPNLKGRIKANNELQIIKKLLRYSEGKALQEKIAAELQGAQNLVTSSIENRQLEKQKAALIQTQKVKKLEKEAEELEILQQFKTPKGYFDLNAYIAANKQKLTDANKAYAQDVKNFQTTIGTPYNLLKQKIAAKEQEKESIIVKNNENDTYISLAETNIQEYENAIKKTNGSIIDKQSELLELTARGETQKIKKVEAEIAELEKTNKAHANVANTLTTNLDHLYQKKTDLKEIFYKMKSEIKSIESEKQFAQLEENYELGQKKLQTNKAKIVEEGQDMRNFIRKYKSQARMQPTQANPSPAPAPAPAPVPAPAPRKTPQEYQNLETLDKFRRQEKEVLLQLEKDTQSHKERKKQFINELETQYIQEKQKRDQITQEQAKIMKNIETKRSNIGEKKNQIQDYENKIIQTSDLIASRRLEPNQTIRLNNQILVLQAESQNLKLTVAQLNEDLKEDIKKHTALEPIDIDESTSFINLTKKYLVEKKKLESYDKTLAQSTKNLQNFTQFIKEYQQRPIKQNSSEYSNLL